MPILWTPTWTIPRDFRISRAQVKGFAIGWQTGTFIQYGQQTIIREIPFGGYRVVFEFDSLFWAADNKMWELEGIFTNAYALAPGSSSPGAMGSIEINFNWQPICNGYLLILALPSLTQTFYWQEYPPVTYSYWNKNALPWKRTPPFINVT